MRLLMSIFPQGSSRARLAPAKRRFSLKRRSERIEAAVVSPPVMVVSSKVVTVTSDQYCASGSSNEGGSLKRDQSSADIPPPAAPLKRENSGGQASSTLKNLSRTDRLFTCPDLLHHSERELTNRLQTLFVVDTQALQVASDPLLHLFDGARPPKFSLEDYVKRLVMYLTNIVDAERTSGHDMQVHSDLAVRYLLVAHILLERLKVTKGMVITPLNVHRLVIVAVIIASKTLDDFQPTMHFFSLLGGVTVAELGKLEVAFLDLLEYKCNVDENQFDQVYERLLGEPRTLYAAV